MLKFQSFQKFHIKNKCCNFFLLFNPCLRWLARMSGSKTAPDPPKDALRARGSGTCSTSKGSWLSDIVPQLALAVWTTKKWKYRRIFEIFRISQKVRIKSRMNSLMAECVFKCILTGVIRNFALIRSDSLQNTLQLLIYIVYNKIKLYIFDEFRDIKFIKITTSWNRFCRKF